MEGITQNGLTRLLLEELQIEVPSPHFDLLETGLLDSLKLVELLTQLEMQFGTQIDINDLDINTFRSIASISEFLDRQKGTGQRAG
jgi:acyl carrier protein